MYYDNYKQFLKQKNRQTETGRGVSGTGKLKS